MSHLIDKTDFPIFNDKSLVYLDSASTSQKPKVVLDTIKKVYEHSNANVHRALYDLGSKSTELYESSRETISKFINAPSSKEVIFTSGTTASINLLSYSLESRLKKDDEILISHMEHHANIVPWQQLSKRVGVKLKYLPLTKSGDIDLENSKKYFTDRTKIVSITHMSNVLGTINPIKKIAKMAKSIGAVYIIDGAQSVSHMPVNVQDLECDFLAFSGHKMLGPTGVGVLWGKMDLLNELDPFYNYCTNEIKLKILGLMIIPPNDKKSSMYFKTLSELNNSLALKELSMGMSADYLEAVKYGSTFVRIGSSIFGSRS